MRKPKYNSFFDWRIVSVPNNLWRLQTGGHGGGTRERDFWENESPPLPLPEALKKLATKERHSK